MTPFDSNGNFQLVSEGGGMRRLAVKGAGATIFSSGVALVVQVASTVVVARILTPRDFGVVAMVTTFSLLLMNFGLNGFTEAVVQREELGESLAANLFWINVGIGLLLTLVFAASGGLMGRFYHDSHVAPVAAGISLTIVLTSTSVLHLALLKRAMRFSAVSVNDIVSSAAQVSVTIVCGLMGWGYWALVAGTVARPLSQTVGAWMMCRWLPPLPRKVEGTAAMVRFALNIYGRFTVNYFARNTDNLLVGWSFGPVALGFYKKAYDLFLLSACQLVSPLTSVAASALSRLDRHSEQYRRYLLTALAVTTFVGMGLGADLTLVGKDVIRLVLGPGWDTAGRIFTYFGPGVGIMLLYSTHGWIHLSIGTAERWFRWVIVEFSVTFLLFLGGLHWGPEGIAMAWTASFWILTVPAFWYAGKPVNFGFGPVLRVVWKYMVASALAGVATQLIVQKIPFFATTASTLAAFEHIVLVSLLFSVLYLVAVVALYGGTGPIRQLVGLAQEALPGRRAVRVTPACAVAPATSALVLPAEEETAVPSGR
jgi:O-antigen/teichoic acid export membrane protein